MNKFLMKGRELEVVYAQAQEKRKTPNEMRGRVVDGKFEAGNGSGHGGGGRRGGSGEVVVAEEVAKSFRDPRHSNG